EKCKGCRFCIEFCPRDVLEMSRDYNAKGYHFPVVAQGKENDCTSCGYCEVTCPDFAIYVRSKIRSISEKDVVLT
ncbi:MAG: 4Fe-4S dicluster domain-containing protein, partial [Elusimicrobia bacterium]|nr:4Fe-4S dicluster domain-containing protein [Elusimicrobiota bacterium]